MSQKYAIAKNRGVNAFFTKTSAFDRPQWVSESAASTFHTPEMAEAALRKLIKHGAYEARIILLKEEIELELPDDGSPAQGVLTRSNAIDNQNAVDANNTDLDDPAEDPEATGDDDTKMVAQVQVTTAEIPLDFQAGSEDDLDGVEDSIAGVEDPDALPPVDDDVTEFDPNGDPKVRMESTEYSKIEYKDPATNLDSFNAPVAGADEDRITVPTNVKSDLSKAITDYKKQAEYANTVDDTRGSFCLTVVAAFEQLQSLLNGGTVSDLKKAQIVLTSWMNPLVSNLPTSVQKYVLSGGRKDTLKDLFDKAWTSKKEQA